MEQYDAIVIGAGQNGLVAAALLARAGQRVVVLERGERLGGRALSERRPDGHLFSAEGFAGHPLTTDDLRRLDLAAHGLRFAPTRALYGLGPEGPPCILYADEAATARGLARHSRRDAERIGELMAFVRRQDWEPPARRSARRGPFFWRRPGPLTGALEALSARGAEAASERLRWRTESLGDLLDDYLETPVLKGLLALPVLMGSRHGPYAAGTAMRLASHPALAPGPGMAGDQGALGRYIAGGASALNEALAAAVVAGQGEIRLNAPVEAVMLENGRAVGAVLADGAELRARAVLSSLDIQQTFRTLFAWETLPKPLASRLAAPAPPVALAKLDLALDAPPSVPRLPEDWLEQPGDIVVTPSLEGLEAAARDGQGDRMPRHLAMILGLPSLVDRTRAPARRCVATLTVAFMPAQLAQGPWSAELRQRFIADVFVALNQVSPGFSDRVSDLRLQLPPDFDGTLGLCAVDARTPASLSPGVTDSPHASPVPGLFVCTASGGAPGVGAATAVLDALDPQRRRP